MLPMLTRFFGVAGVLSALTVLSACAHDPIVEPMTAAEFETLTCRDLWKESERLHRIIANARHGGDPLLGGPSQERKAAVLQAAEHRLSQVREASVQKMCTYG